MGNAIFYDSELISNEGLFQLESEEIYEYESPFERVLNKIDEFVLLNEDWDGYGAAPINGEIGEKVKSFIHCLNADEIDKVSDIFPNPHGTITIEWENHKGEKLSLEIGQSTYSYFVDLQNGNPILVDGIDTPNVNEISEQIKKLGDEEIPEYFS